MRHNLICKDAIITANNGLYASEAGVSSSSDRGLVDPQSPPLARPIDDRMASRGSQRNWVVVKQPPAHGKD